MHSHIEEYVEAAVEVAREDDRLLRIDETARKIAAAAGEPDHVDDIAELLLRTCIKHGITVEIEHASDVQRRTTDTPRTSGGRLPRPAGFSGRRNGGKQCVT